MLHISSCQIERVDAGEDAGEVEVVDAAPTPTPTPMQILTTNNNSRTLIVIVFSLISLDIGLVCLSVVPLIIVLLVAVMN